MWPAASLHDGGLPSRPRDGVLTALTFLFQREDWNQQRWLDWRWVTSILCTVFDYFFSYFSPRVEFCLNEEPFIQNDPFLFLWLKLKPNIFCIVPWKNTIFLFQQPTLMRKKVSFLTSVRSSDTGGRGNTLLKHDNTWKLLKCDKEAGQTKKTLSRHNPLSEIITVITGIDLNFWLSGVLVEVEMLNTLNLTIYLSFLFYFYSCFSLLWLYPLLNFAMSFHRIQLSLLPHLRWVHIECWTLWSSLAHCQYYRPLPKSSL